MMKYIYLTLFILTASFTGFSQTKQEKKAQRREQINEMIKQEEEGALIYSKQGLFGIKFNTDGYGVFYEHGKYKTITTTNIWWAELGERKDPKETKVTSPYSSPFSSSSSYQYGKQNNFYYLSAGIGQQRLIGGKGNKNGVAVSAIYGGGLSLGMLKPYYLKLAAAGGDKDIRYNPADTANIIAFLTGPVLGTSGFTKGFGEITYVPGVHARAALRFDYGRFNELVSALEVGVGASYYTKNMPIMVTQEEDKKKFFFNGYIMIEFGSRKK